MFILQVAFILLLPFALLQVVSKKNIGFSTAVLFISCIALSYMAGFRLDSPDYNNYARYFNLLSQGGDYKQINIVAADPAFAYLNYFFANFSNSPLIIFSFFSLISVAINLSCYQKYSPYFLFCVLFYMAHTYVAREMMQIRAGLACALCLYSIRFILEKKLRYFIVTISVALLFHLGAAVFMMAYFIGNARISRKTIGIVILVSLVIGILFPLGGLFKQLPAISFLERVQYYNNSKYGGGAGVLTNLVILKGILLSAFCFYYYQALAERNKYFEISFKLYAFSLVWYLLWNDFEIFAARIATFYSITEVLLLSFIPLIMKTKENKYLCSVLLCFVAASIFSLNYFTGKWEGVLLPFSIA